MAKPRAVIVGGKGFNVSKQYHQYFEVVRHFDQDSSGRVTSVKDVDIILVIRDFVDHSLMNHVATTFPGVPIVATRNGWSHMYTELQRRNLLPALEPSTVEVDQEPPVPVIPEPEVAPIVTPGNAVAEEEAPKPVLSIVQEPAGPAAEPQEDGGETSEDKLKYLMELLKLSNGEVTPEISELYREKFGDRIPGPTAAAARRRLGYATPTRESVPPLIAKNPHLQESMILLQAADKLVVRRNSLLQEREEIDREIASIDAELKVYAPLIQHVDAIKMMTNRIRVDLERRAQQNQRIGGVGNGS